MLFLLLASLTLQQVLGQLGPPPVNPCLDKCRDHFDNCDSTIDTYCCGPSCPALKDVLSPTCATTSWEPAGTSGCTKWQRTCTVENYCDIYINGVAALEFTQEACCGCNECEHYFSSPSCLANPSPGPGRCGPLGWNPDVTIKCEPPTGGSYEFCVASSMDCYYQCSVNTFG